MANRPIQAANVEVQYNVVNGNAITPQKVSVPYGSTAQTVMEMGANAKSELKFQATYYGADLGYFVDKIGDTPNAPTKKYWIMYVGQEPYLQPSPVGISYWIPPPNSTVEMRFEDTAADHPLHGFRECKKGK